MRIMLHTGHMPKTAQLIINPIRFEKQSNFDMVVNIFSQGKTASLALHGSENIAIGVRTGEYQFDVAEGGHAIRTIQQFKSLLVCRIERILYQFQKAERYAPHWEEIASVVFFFGVIENILAGLTEIGLLVVATGEHDTVNSLKFVFERLLTFTIHERDNPSTLRLNIFNDTRRDEGFVLLFNMHFLTNKEALLVNILTHDSDDRLIVHFFSSPIPHCLQIGLILIHCDRQICHLLLTFIKIFKKHTSLLGVLEDLAHFIELIVEIAGAILN